MVSTLFFILSIMDKLEVQRELIEEIKKCQSYIDDYKNTYEKYKKSKQKIIELNNKLHGYS